MRITYEEYKARTIRIAKGFEIACPWIKVTTPNEELNMKYYDYPDLKTNFKCPRCPGTLYDVTEYFELNQETFTCENDTEHSFFPHQLQSNFKCEKCYATSSAKAWNAATAREYGNDIERISADTTCMYICPVCGDPDANPREATYV